MPSSRRSSRRPYYADHRPLNENRARGGLHYEAADDGEWSVRKVTSSDKSYRCPGCQQEIVPGTPHVVVWNRDAIGGEAAGLEFRRHWHNSCWQRRTRLR